MRCIKQLKLSAKKAWGGSTDAPPPTTTVGGFAFFFIHVSPVLAKNKKCLFFF